MERTPSAFNETEQHMRATIMHAPGDVRVEERDKPAIQQPTDAIKVLLRP